ncbi:hypothetical protein PC9H_002297 [Pleurotus ostreatus]|uniref:Uncharacterized protein n=1 Tax=Pleurotus ostreatus TaxID=5322 RepID=A0A8H7DMI9_PLEOS|nr:uncharacterized protein PC9H_002297 [Pleurotus ostreatus]KAF7419705.1 hypothetical protein PC9H_002297 [Pleurotus ostreatus]KAJ8689417.1 hypothetical protein PTI98_012320 [Pleurotus ostreatus]
MPTPRREYLSLFLANSSESNVRGRPDFHSPWIGVPRRGEAGANIFVKKEHGEPFSVSIVHKHKEYDRVENVRKVYLRTDIEMCSVGIYHSLFDFEKGESEQVVAILADGTRRQWAATLGEVKAPDLRTLEVHLSPQPERNLLLEHKLVLIDSLNTMMNLARSKGDRVQASDMIDVTLPLFRALAAELAP